MEDSELASYAAANKSDPFIFPLAFQESQSRKRLRASKDAQAAGQTQPKVVDQNLAEMAPQAQALPEDQGIAQLSAPNMQTINKAGGGIIAFEEGGEVPRFNGQTGSSVSGFRDIFKMTPEEIKEAAARKLRGSAATDTLKGVATTVPEAGATSYLGALKNTLSKYGGAAALIGQNLYGTSDEELKTLREADARRAMQGMPESTFKGTGDTSDLDKMLAEVTATKDAAQPGATPDTPTATTGKPNARATGADGAPLPGLPSVDSFANQVMGIDKLLPAKEKAQERDKFMAERDDVSKPVWAKAEGMINKEKERLSEGKEQDFYMALIEGGLAAAAGEGPNALQNIAKGFSQGAKSYSSALKDFRKASQENSKMELDIERARAAEKRGDMDAYQKYEDSIKNRNADIDKLKTSGIFALQNVHTSGQYQQRAAATSAAAHLKAAQLPGANERLFATLGGGTDTASVVKGMKLFQEAQADKTGASYAKLYADYSANAAKNGVDAMSPVEFAQNMQQFMGAMNGGGFSEKPTNTAVRTLPPTK
jgi:hypothetical protein